MEENVGVFSEHSVFALVSHSISVSYSAIRLVRRKCEMKLTVNPSAQNIFLTQNSGVKHTTVRPGP